MAVTYHSAYLILSCIQKKLELGSKTLEMLTLGSQDCLITDKQIDHLIEVFGGSQRSIEQLNTDRKATFKNLMIAFNIQVKELDVSDFEGAEIILDLNYINTKIKRSFDIVFDGGTLEHVFHVPNALKNLTSFVKKGGLIMHLNPANNHVDHGFYSFSPTFYADYYSSSGFKHVLHYLIEYDVLHSRSDWRCYNYDPKIFEKLSFGGWSAKPLINFYCGEYVVDVHRAQYPQQWTYVNQWNPSSVEKDARRISLAFVKSLLKKRSGVVPLDKSWTSFMNFAIKRWRYYVLKPKPTNVIKGD